MLDIMKDKGGAIIESATLKKKVLSASDELKVLGNKYFFSSNGNDANDGLSMDKPKKSLSLLENIDLKTGDGVFLERGSVFRTAQTIKLCNGVSYGAYGEGSKPEILGSQQNYADEALWEYTNVKNIWKLRFVDGFTNVGVIVFDDGTGAGWQHIYKSELREEFDFVSNGTGLYIYCNDNPGKKYHSIEIGIKRGLFFIDKFGHDIVVDNISFKYTGAHALNSIGKVNNITITNCEFSWIGGSIQGVPTDPIVMFGNAIEFWDSSENICVKGNYIHQIYDAGITFQGHGPFRNITFKGNLIEYCEMSIEFWNMLHDEDITDILLEDNITQYSGYGWGRKRIQEGRANHIYVGHTPTDYKNLSVTIKNNIFDCCYGFLFRIPWKNYRPEAQRYVFEGNSYYQCDRTGENDLGFGGGIGNGAFLYGVAEVGKVPTYANNQQEFEKAVKAVERNPRIVKWIDI